MERRGRGQSQGIEIVSIKREHVDAGRIDLAEAIAGRKLLHVHPGEILLAEGARCRCVSGLPVIIHSRSHAECEMLANQVLKVVAG